MYRDGPVQFYVSGAELNNPQELIARSVAPAVIGVIGNFVPQETNGLAKPFDENKKYVMSVSMQEVV